MSNSQSVHIQKLSEYDWSLAHFGTLDYNFTVYCLIASFFAVALWLVIDLTAQVHLTFKQYRGLYYFSILVTTWGIAFHAIAFTLKLFVPTSDKIGTTVLAKLGWVMNTTGFAMVLYSRLNLVIHSRTILRIVLVAILVDAVLLHTPIVVCSFGMSTDSWQKWISWMNIFERIQIVGFTVQDLTISTIYTWTSARLLNDRYSVRRRNLFAALLFAQTFGFFADMSMLVLDYENMFTLKASLHPFIYAIKLKIEFLVLNQLSILVRPDGGDLAYWEGGSELNLSPELRRQRDSAWSFRFSRSKIEKNNICLRCQSLDGLNRESSIVEHSEKSLTRTNSSFVPQVVLPRDFAGASLHDDGSLTVDKPCGNQIKTDDDQIEDLERQYLGKFGG
jgi:hypothetical protein